MKKESYLIYDSSCAFCTGLASYFQRKWNIKIVPNTSVTGKNKELIKKDVHFFDLDEKNNEYKLFSGAEAAVRMIGRKYKFLIFLYSIFGIRQLIQSFYWIVKKSRKYVGNLF